MDSSVSEKDETWFLRVCHHVPHELYSLPNILRVVKSGGMRWTGHVARMEEGRGVQRVLVGNLEETIGETQT